VLAVVILRLTLSASSRRWICSWHKPFHVGHTKIFIT
jgi:hypothetical protein